MFLAVSVPSVASASRLASMGHSAVTAARVSSLMGGAAVRRPLPQKYLRARTPVACDAFSDEFSDEYEDALARYTALGLFDNVTEEVEEVDDDDDTTPEEMAALSQEYMAAAEEERTRQNALREEQLVAAAEAEERQRIAQWEEHFVNTMRTDAEKCSSTWDENRASSVPQLYREPERGC